MGMIEVNILGNAPSRGFGYGKGKRLVPADIAAKMIKAGVAEKLSIEVQTATLPKEEVRTAVVDTTPKKKPKRRKK